MAVRLRNTDPCGLGNVLAATTVAFTASTRRQTQQAKTVAGTYDALRRSPAGQDAQAEDSMAPGETAMELNRRDVLKGAAVATAGSLTVLTGHRCSPCRQRSPRWAIGSVRWTDSLVT